MLFFKVPGKDSGAGSILINMVVIVFIVELITFWRDNELIKKSKSLQSRILRFLIPKPTIILYTFFSPKILSKR